MSPSITKLKRRLSTVKTNSWHYRATSALWKPKRVDNSKACSYYWVKLPTSIVAAPVMLILAIVCLACVVVLGLIAAVVGLFIGRFPVFFSDVGEDEDLVPDFFLPYKELPSGKRMKVAPWEVASPFAVTFCAYLLVFEYPAIGLWVVVGTVGVLFLGVVLYAATSSWKLPIVQLQRSKIKEAWDNACPPLTVVETSRKQTQ